MVDYLKPNIEWRGHGGSEASCLRLGGFYFADTGKAFLCLGMLYGCCMDDVCMLYGCCKDIVSMVYGCCVDVLGIFYDVYHVGVRCARAAYGVCSYFHSIRTVFAQYSHSIRTVFAQYSHSIRTVFARKNRSLRADDAGGGKEF